MIDRYCVRSSRATATVPQWQVFALAVIVGLIV